MSKIAFTSISSRITGDGKELKKDKDGYYEIILGALNMHNSGGAFYEYTSEVAELFTNSSVLLRRMNGGYLRSELGHPKMLPGMKLRDFISRISKIEEKSVCGHFKEIKVVESDKSDVGSDVPIMLIKGKVKPMGPYADTLQREFDNPYSNSAFSIRSMTRDRVVGGKTIKTLSNIITWDFVNEPGISIANKKNSIGLESQDLFSFDSDDLDTVNDIISDIDRMEAVSTEDDSVILHDIKQSLLKCSNGECLLGHWL